MNIKLLLVNNSVTTIEKIRPLISSEFPNINLHEINNGLNPLNEYKTFQPDLLIYEINNNVNNIENSLSLIHEMLAVKRIPTIALSTTYNYNKLYKAGITNFIQKPFSDVELISNLRTLINLIEIQESIKTKEKEIETINQKIQVQIESELKQRELIVKKNKEIMADIRYASRIQQAILPDLKLIKELTKDYFILHQPKSHVSGDFYWVCNLNGKKIFAVGDCTGHGISGGLMHMLGSVYLREIVSRGKFEKASDILDQLREHIMMLLKQTGESGEAQDGLDISLCILDDYSSTLQFSGANNSLYIIRNKELTELKGDRMPVGIHINFNKPFTNHTIKLESDDQLYMFSDGYADQFGGPKGKKFRYNRFKDLLREISDKPMYIQKEILNNTHDKWRGPAEQIDDILVFGIKIK